MKLQMNTDDGALDFSLEVANMNPASVFISDGSIYIHLWFVFICLHHLCPSVVYFAVTSSTVVFNVAEFGPTRMSKRPGSTTRFMSRFQNHSLLGVMANVTVLVSPGCNAIR